VINSSVGTGAPRENQLQKKAGCRLPPDALLICWTACSAQFCLEYIEGSSDKKYCFNICSKKIA